MLKIVCLALITAAAGAAPANLVFNGDFEQEAAQNPPAGWSMWGAQTYKVPANFTRDTTNPHSGAGCFRIFHPAGTAGYIVTAPEQAIRPKEGMMYTLSFWARSDKAGPAQFGVTAYESIQPFADAPSPGSWPITVGPEWKQFRFTITEGWDFFANRSRYLLLTFHATRTQAEERTLWIDDVAVTEQRSTRAGRLVDESTLKYTPLQHRLKPGERLDFSVDATKRLRPATRDAGGISFHRVCGWTGQPYDKQGDYTLDPQLETAIRDLRLPMTRFYGVGDEPFGVEGGIDRVADVCRREGISQEHTVLELETQSAATSIAPEVWARGVRYALGKGYHFRYWEVANEPYSSMWGQGGAFPTAEEYAAHVKAVSRAVRAVDPAAQIGVGINSMDHNWGGLVLKQAAGAYDFVVAHYYAGGDIYRRRPEASILTENYRTLDRALRVNALIKALNGGRPVYQYDTEWGCHSSGPNGERADNVDRNANIIGTLHRAVRLIYYAREGMLRGASSWQMFSRLTGQGFGILSQQAPDKRFLLYWLYYYFNRHVGESVLDIAGTAPYYAPAAGDGPNLKPGEFPGPLTPVLATLSKDGKALYLVIANGSWDRTVPCRAEMRGFPAGRVSGTVLSQSDPDAKPLLERKEDAISPFAATLAGRELTCSVPPHSVVFVTVERK